MLKVEMTPLRSAVICTANDDATSVEYNRKCVNYNKKHVKALIVRESMLAYRKQPVRGVPALETWHALQTLGPPQGIPERTY